ncbi:MAG: transporter substrate-binding protein, partial [Leptolyngbyaceae cyanobacterium CSU_1_3]|nr:transporter substrate-binding protein [Leptolyngbyaceae cyanobacterium CSU_1_3]
MSKRFRRREFLIFGSAATGSILLKACAPAAPPIASSPTASPAASPASAAASGGIKVGILHSLSGTMSISEKSVVEAEQMAIEEINKAGGVLGKQIEAIVEDGNSDWPTFAEKA